jgi:hypothetical protein
MEMFDAPIEPGEAVVAPAGATVQQTKHCSDCVHWAKKGKPGRVRLCRHPNLLINSPSRKKDGAESCLLTGPNFNCGFHEFGETTITLELKDFQFTVGPSGEWEQVPASKSVDVDAIQKKAYSENYALYLKEHLPRIFPAGCEQVEAPQASDQDIVECPPAEEVQETNHGQ